MDDFLEKMRRIGMSENEAKVYQVLFRLKTATPREVHELSGVPRNKTYECLAALEERGFLKVSPTTPIRYYFHDIIKTFDRLKKDTQLALEDAAAYLLTLDSDHLQREKMMMQAYELNSEWAIENRLNMIFRQTNTELIILCQDASSLKKYIPDLRLFARTMQKERKIALYVVFLKEKDAADVPIRCYVPKKMLNEMLVSQKESSGLEITPKIMVMADRTESLAIADHAEKELGIYFFGRMQERVLSKFILDNIRSLSESDE
ncbi:TrmB family transcriptional regulator [Methanorbis furvi]|uniref:Transcription regulator TrmB N-terminal domain-containing protein n=1 Tax=Methanorbis furvi TaxID=3028299 RepID=A0AAE4SAL4_9EURY|nr:hypothetical protein [Methanocorpusculaceae archaeon Ag1]